MRTCRTALSLLFTLSIPVVGEAQARKSTDQNAAGHEKRVTRKEVPAAVLAAFARAFPKARVIGYAEEKEEGKTFYEVESKEGEVHRDATFLPDGKLELVEESISVKDLPAAIGTALAKEKGQCEMAERLARGKVVEYEFHMKDGTREYEVVMDATGKVLKREPATKD